MIINFNFDPDMEWIISFIEIYVPFGQSICKYLHRMILMIKMNYFRENNINLKM